MPQRHLASERRGLFAKLAEQCRWALDEINAGSGSAGQVLARNSSANNGLDLESISQAEVEERLANNSITTAMLQPTDAVTEGEDCEQRQSPMRQDS